MKSEHPTNVLRAFAGKSPRGWPTNSERAAKMREYRRLNQQRVKRNMNTAENLVAATLSQKSRFKFKRQVAWGHRIFDFWSHELGVAIEVDGAGHDRVADLAQDRWQARRCGLITFRLRNGDRAKLLRIINVLPRVGTWKERRAVVLEVARRRSGLRSTPLPDEQTTESQPSSEGRTASRSRARQQAAGQNPAEPSRERPATAQVALSSKSRVVLRRRTPGTAHGD